MEGTRKRERGKAREDRERDRESVKGKEMDGWKKGKHRVFYCLNG